MWSNVLKLVAAGATVVGAIAAIEAIAEAKEAAKKAAKEKADANFRRAEKAIDLEYKQAQEEFAKARAELDPTIHSISEDYAKACLRQYGMALSMLKASPDNEIILGMAAERRRIYLKSNATSHYALPILVLNQLICRKTTPIKK